MPSRDEVGRPQSPRAGRWEILQEMRGKAEPRPRRWYDVPWWYRVLDRFGMPTLFLLMTLSGIGWTGRFVLEKWDEHEKAVAAAMTQQAMATTALAMKVEEMSDNTARALAIVLDRFGHPHGDSIGPPPPTTKKLEAPRSPPQERP